MNLSEKSQMNPKNSKLLTVFLLVNAMIGSGILNQPYVFMKSGIIGGLLGYFIGVLGTWAGLIILTAAGVKCHIYDFSELAHQVYGKFGDALVDFSITISSFGCQLCYLIIIGQSMAEVFQSWGFYPILCNQIVTTLIAIVFFITPSCMYRQFGHLALISVFSITAITLCLFLVLIGGPATTKSQFPSGVKLFDPLGTVTSAGSIILTLSCAAANFHAYLGADSSCQSLPEWSSITAWAVGLGSVMCLAMGIGNVAPVFTDHLFLSRG
jgi:amino acid permease